jgi:UDP-3-O-[3-hydroxymyristoyl] glucosamine N-acyltransferase
VLLSGKKGRTDVHVTVQDLAALVAGQVLGDGSRAIRAARPLSEAGPEDVTFVENDRHARHLKNCRAGAVVLPPGLADRHAQLRDPAAAPVTVLRVEDPLSAFVAIAQHLHGRAEAPPHGLDPRVALHPSVRVGSDPSAHPFVCVGEGTVLGDRCRLHSGVVIGRRCRLGDDVVLHPNVVLYDGTVLGNRVVIHANAVLGAAGFGYRTQQGRHVLVPQFGAVEVGDDVEIGAGTTIDRGTFTATRIGAGTKIDNQVQIGHNSQIGRHNLIVSHVGVAGSVSTGDYVILAGQVGVADHVHVGDHAQIGARSGVLRDVPPRERMLGAPAQPEREAKRVLLCMERLPALCREVRQIEQHLGLTPDGQSTRDEGQSAGGEAARAAG